MHRRCTQLALHEASRDAGTVDGGYAAENVVRESEIGQSLAGDDAVRDLAAFFVMLRA